MCRKSFKVSVFKVGYSDLIFMSLNPSSRLFNYKDEASGRTMPCGLIKLKLALELVNPNLVVDYSLKEKELENLTLASCDEDVHVYLTSIQEKRNEISSNLPGKEEYPVNRFVTSMFAQLEKSTCDEFLKDVRDSKSKWIKNRETFNVTEEIKGLIKLFVNYRAGGTWKPRGKEHEPKLLALAT